MQASRHCSGPGRQFLLQNQTKPKRFSNQQVNCWWKGLTFETVGCGWGHPFQNLKPPTFQEAISPSLSKLNFYKNIQKKLKMGCVWCFWCFALTVKCYSEWFLFVCKVILKRHFWLHDLKHNLNYNKNLIIFATYLEKHLLLPSSLLQSFSEFPGTICQNLAFFIKMCFF